MVANSAEPTRPAPAGRDWLKFVLVQLTGLLVAAFVWLPWQLVEPISHTVVLFLLGAACAFVLAEPSSLLARRLGGNRMLGILLAYLILFGIIIGAMLLLAVPFVSQASSFTANLPTYVSDIERQVGVLDTWLAAQGVQIKLQAVATQVAGALSAGIHDVLDGLMGAASTIGGIAMNGVMVLVISVYFLTSAAAMRRNTLYAVPKRYRAVHEFIRSSAARVMGGYLRGQLIMAAVIGTLAGVGTGLLGLPYFCRARRARRDVRADTDVWANCVGSAGGHRGPLHALADRSVGNPALRDYSAVRMQRARLESRATRSACTRLARVRLLVGES
jgi:predicted PurR-regulated permease PerM